MDVLASFQICEGGPETMVHVLRNCRAARSFWNSFPPPLSTTLFYGKNLIDWLRLNYCSMKRHSTINLNWGVVFSFGVWSPWLRRNGIMFRDERPNLNVRMETISKATEFAYVGVNGKMAQSRQRISVNWSKPPLNWCKVNLDSLSLGNPGQAGGGGLIRNDKEEWIRGYVRAIGSITSVVAELWPLRDGIRLCIALKLPTVIFELDAKLIVELLQKEDGQPNSIGALVSDCKARLKEIPIVQIQHCYREANKCADALARKGALLPQDFVVFLNPLMEVSLLLRLDSIGVSYKRYVPFCNHVP